MIEDNNILDRSNIIRQPLVENLSLSLAQYFGHYSYGHQAGRWKKNKVHDNIGYGFDPHDDSDHLLIKENEVCVYT